MRALKHSPNWTEQTFCWGPIRNEHPERIDRKMAFFKSPRDAGWVFDLRLSYHGCGLTGELPAVVCLNLCGGDTQ